MARLQDDILNRNSISNLHWFHMYEAIQYVIVVIIIIVIIIIIIIEGSLEVKLPTIWRDEKQSRAEAQRRGRLEERRSEEKE